MSRPIRLLATAYGPPWNNMQGTGTTATGINLRANPRQYLVAVDPRVIPLGSKLRIPSNPFGDPNLIFTAADTGGAIKGNRLDFYDWRGRKTQLGFGKRMVEAHIVGHGGAPQSPAAPAANGQVPFDPGVQGSTLSALLSASMASQRPAPPVTGPPAPSFSAHAPLPQGYTPVASAPPAPPPLSVAQQLLQASQLPNLTLPQIKQGPIAQPGSQPDKVRSLFERAQSIDAEHLPYQWGGGHGPTPAKPGVPVDCSGAVSRLLGINPRVSGQFESFGQAGRGRNVTIYANAHHVLMGIRGPDGAEHLWGTSAGNPQGGPGWIPRSRISPQYLRGFVARHPTGM